MWRGLWYSSYCRNTELSMEIKISLDLSRMLYITENPRWLLAWTENQSHKASGTNCNLSIIMLRTRKPQPEKEKWRKDKLQQNCKHRASEHTPRRAGGRRQAGGAGRGGHSTSAVPKVGTKAAHSLNTQHINNKTRPVLKGSKKFKRQLTREKDHRSRLYAPIPPNDVRVMHHKDILLTKKGSACLLPHKPPERDTVSGSHGNHIGVPSRAFHTSCPSQWHG